MTPKQAELKQRLDKILQLYAKGLDTSQIAARIGWDNEKVRKLIRKHGKGANARTA